ncbi:MAG: Eco57I restriction-modification methylase domain-containing protein [Kiritimatiellae bacterium]|nr:Eco57I restriction-modification methylase domain-containing protein [Kiritimatiellia bacterium]
MAAGTTKKKKERGKAKAARETAAVVTVPVSPPIPCLVRFNEYPVADVLNKLLADKTTGENIRFATDGYSSAGLAAATQITAARILRDSELIRPRVEKSRTVQSERTKRNAEVFTPLFVCQRMNDWLDRAGAADAAQLRSGEAEKLRSGDTGKLRSGDAEKLRGGDVEKLRGGAAASCDTPAVRPTAESWRRYVDTRVLEITCGEAPFIVSRYDAATGQPIPLTKRIGILDRKLRVVNENAADEAEWVKWALRSLESVYGFEYQGDSLLLTRANLLITFAENLESQWGRRTTRSELTAAANRIVWNFWQMDGLTDAVPKYGDKKEPQEQYLPGFEECAPEKIPVQEDLPWEDEFLVAKDAKSERTDTSPECILFDWRARRKVIFNEIKKGTTTMRFDYAIGNPPYQEETASDSTRMPPIYDKFMDEAYKVADKVELITPARFLFNSGYTSKAWNGKMLNDSHFKVLEYIQKSEDVFANTDITGGIVISYRDVAKNFIPIRTFTTFQELNSLLRKVSSKGEKSLMTVVAPALSFNLSHLMKKENPHLLDRLRTSCFETLKDIFFEEKPHDHKQYVRLLGLLDAKRTFRYVRRDYLIDSRKLLDKYKVLLPKSNGSGAIGEVSKTLLIGEPLVGDLLVGFTQSFIAVGLFDTRVEAENCLKYIKTKFARTMLGILKVTQDNPPEKWRYVPLQDFTSASDIDWAGTVAEIDAQLYKKYGLTKKEIAFIESHVKEME